MASNGSKGILYMVRNLYFIYSFNVKCEIRMQQLDQAEFDERSKESQKLYQQDIHRERTISQPPNGRTIHKLPGERVMHGSSTTVHDGVSDVALLAKLYPLHIIAFVMKVSLHT